MPRMEDILKFMKTRRPGVGICHECIARNINLAPLQKVDTELIHLMTLGKVRRAKTSCNCCGKTHYCWVLRF